MAVKIRTALVSATGLAVAAGAGVGVGLTLDGGDRPGAPPAGPGIVLANADLEVAADCDALLDSYIRRGLDRVGPYGWDFGGVVMLCVGRVLLLMRGYGVVLVNRAGMGAAGSFVTRAIADTAHAADSDAYDPQQRARPRENAEQGTDFRLPRSFQLHSVISWKAVRALWGVHPILESLTNQPAAACFMS